MSLATAIPSVDGPVAGEKVPLPITPRELWRAIETDWAKNDPFNWESLAMLHLFSGCGWSITMISKSFGLHKGQVSRRIHNCILQLAEHFQIERDERYGKLSKEFSTFEHEDIDDV